ncbi:hypothetical protein OC525_22255, partial [Vibrio vulnificus]|nr:hypothetical protein [Vibrio vulnificus]
YCFLSSGANMNELLNTLMVCAVLVSLFPLIKSSKGFYEEWSEMENEHWRSRGAPPFVVFHFGMFLFVPMLFGKDLDQLNNNRLLKLRSDLRYSFAIFSLLLLSSQLN